MKKIKKKSKKTKTKVIKKVKKYPKSVKKKVKKYSKSVKKKVKKIKSKVKSSNKNIRKIKNKEIPKKQNFILKIINFQNSLRPQIKFKINLNIEKYIQAFFDKIANTISDYKQTKKDETRRLKLEKLEK